MSSIRCAKQCLSLHANICTVQYSITRSISMIRRWRYAGARKRGREKSGKVATRQVYIPTSNHAMCSLAGEGKEPYGRPGTEERTPAQQSGETHCSGLQTQDARPATCCYQSCWYHKDMQNSFFECSQLGTVYNIYFGKCSILGFISFRTT